MRLPALAYTYEIGPRVQGTMLRPDLAGVDTGAPIWAPAFPSADLVGVAASVLWAAAGSRRLDPAAGCPEGPSIFVTVTPGSVSFRRVDLARGARAAEREVSRRSKRVAEGVGWQLGRDERAAHHAVWAAGLLDVDEGPSGDAPAVDDDCDPLSRFPGRQKISEWSAKSRANMVRRLTTLDYAPLFADGALPAMVTLTMPDGWLELAPNGKAFKALVRTFGKRYARAWGKSLLGVWKLEFQRRGAPHLHALICPPHGYSKDGRLWRDWFAETWADVLGLSGETWEHVRWMHSRPEACADYSEGLRMTDPKRVGVYFSGHSLVKDKEYQHVVPEAWRSEGDGPGRFWGVWGLAPVESPVLVTIDQAVKLARVARKIQASHKPERVCSVWRSDTATGKVRRRKVKRRVKRLPGTWGFLAVNDGPSFAMTLARVLVQ